MADKVFGRCEYGRKAAIFIAHFGESLLWRRDLIRDMYHFEDLRSHRPFSLEPSILFAAKVPAATAHLAAGSSSSAHGPSRPVPAHAESSASRASGKETHTKRSSFAL